MAQRAKGGAYEGGQESGRYATGLQKPLGLGTCGLCVCVCVSQTLFQREVRFSDERIHDFHDHHAGGHRKPIELCPTKLSMVSSGYQG